MFSSRVQLVANARQAGLDELIRARDEAIAGEEFGLVHQLEQPVVLSLKPNRACEESNLGCEICPPAKSDYLLVV